MKISSKSDKKIAKLWNFLGYIVSKNVGGRSKGTLDLTKEIDIANFVKCATTIQLVILIFTILLHVSSSVLTCGSTWKR